MKKAILLSAYLSQKENILINEYLRCVERKSNCFDAIVDIKY